MGKNKKTGWNSSGQPKKSKKNSPIVAVAYEAAKPRRSGSISGVSQEGAIKAEVRIKALEDKIAKEQRSGGNSLYSW